MCNTQAFKIKKFSVEFTLKIKLLRIEVHTTMHPAILREANAACNASFIIAWSLTFFYTITVQRPCTS